MNLKEQIISTCAAMPTVIGALHLLMFLDHGRPENGWAALTGFVVAFPFWLALYIIGRTNAQV